MMLILSLLAYVFGRVVMQVSIGKLMQKSLFPGYGSSETLGIFLGVVIWTVLLSLPYLWPFALFSLFVAGIGLVLTARSKTTWQRD
jgi:hypothetical protein